MIVRVNQVGAHPPGVDYLLGADCGKECDPAALCVVARTLLEQPEDEEHPHYYELLFAKELQLGTPYTDFVDYLELLATDPSLKGLTSLAVDHTGVGQVVLDMLRDRESLAEVTWAVYYTAGKNEKQEGMNFNVPKKNLVHNLLVMMQRGQMGVAENCPDAHLLKRQLLKFVMKRTAAARDRYEAEATRDHDDLVNALACAVWLGERIDMLDGTESDGFAPYRAAGWR